MTDYMDVTTNAAVIPTIIAAQTLGALRSTGVLANVVNRDYEDEVAAAGDTVTVGSRAALTVNDKAAGANVTMQDPTTAGISVTLDKHKEVTFGQEDIARMFSRPELIAGYAMDAAIGLRAQIEKDLAALYSGLSQTISAIAGLGEDDFREAGRLLNSAKAPLENRWAVLHEDAYSEAAAIEKIINRDYQGDDALEAIKRGFLGFFGSFNIVMSQDITVATSQCKNLFIHRDALTLVTRRMRVTQMPGVFQTFMVENGIPLRVTMSYDHLGLAERMTLDIIYGVAELRDNHGVAVSTTEV